MNRESIKSELIKEVELLFNKRENQLRKTEGIHKLTALSEKMGKADGFSHLIIDKLNEILEKRNIEFETEKEKGEFLEFINPTVKDLIIRFIRN